MRDNFWDLDPFTVGLNPGLLNFDKPFIRSKAPHIRGKMRLLERILGRMVEVRFFHFFIHAYFASIWSFDVFLAWIRDGWV